MGVGRANAGNVVNFSPTYNIGGDAQATKRAVADTMRDFSADCAMLATRIIGLRLPKMGHTRKWWMLRLTAYAEMVSCRSAVGETYWVKLIVARAAFYNPAVYRIARERRRLQWAVRQLRRASR